MKAGTKTPPVFLLRLPFTTRAQAAGIAHSLGISINEFITDAVLEKIEHVEQIIADHEKQQGTTGEDGSSTSD